MKKLSGLQKVGIALIVIQAIVLCNAIFSGILIYWGQVLSYSFASGLIQIITFNIVGIIGIILFIVGRKRNA